MRETVGSESRSGDLTVAGDVSGTIAQSQVTDLTTDLAAKAPLASPTFTGTVEAADIEVSGGVFLGGTAAANELDDYEEGIFTPTLIATGTDFTSVTYDTVTGGAYTKIGNLVHVQLALRTDSITVGSAAGSLAIGGLPFVSSSQPGNSEFVPISVVAFTPWAGEVPISARVSGGDDFAVLFYRSSVDGTDTASDFSDAATTTNANLIYVAGTYLA